MESPFIFVLGILFIVVGIPVISGTLLSYHKEKNKMNATRGNELDKEETELLNDLHKSLERMEKRIEALETILMDKRR
jgi:phage shock protein B